MSYLVNFGELPWSNPVTGLRYKTFIHANQQIKLVEFSEGFVDQNWCLLGHAGYVLDGAFSNDYSGSIERYEKGDVLFIPAGEQAKHRAVLGKGEKATLLMFELIGE